MKLKAMQSNDDVRNGTAYIIRFPDEREASYHCIAVDIPLDIARLMAAAPDLLKALRDMHFTNLIHYPVTPTQLQAAHDAIAKAAGEQL